MWCGVVRCVGGLGGVWGSGVMIEVVVCGECIVP